MKRLRLIISRAGDWSAARIWYRDVLGLSEAGGWDGGAGNRGAFFAVDSGEIEVMEESITAFTPIPDTDRPPQMTLALQVEDLDREWKRLLDHGIRVLQPPTDRPWGSRDFLVADPNRLPVLVFQHDGEG
jgi:uncharacterized glyoxalase superfamily protein PhnB